MNPISQHMSRRRFLRWAAVFGAGSVVGWRFLLPSAGLEFEQLHRLSQNDARILAAAYSAITLDAAPDRVKAAITFMDSFFQGVSDSDFFEFRAALRLVEHTPVIFHGYLNKFTALSLEDQQRCLDGWRLGATWRRPVFSALKDVSYLYLYTRPESWAEIGYTGPMVGPEGAGAHFEKRYLGLESK